MVETAGEPPVDGMEPIAFESVRDRLLRAIERDDGDAARECREALAELRETSPDDPLLLAYEGSAVLFSAKHAWLPWKKGELAKAGLALLDEAIALAPESLELAFVRASSTRELPGFFGRAEESRADLARVVEHGEEAVRAGRLRPEVSAAALALAAADRTDDSGAPREGRSTEQSTAESAPPGESP